MKKIESLNSSKFNKLSNDQMNQLSGGWKVIWQVVNSDLSTTVGLQGGLLNMRDDKFTLRND